MSSSSSPVTGSVVPSYLSAFTLMVSEYMIHMFDTLIYYVMNGVIIILSMMEICLEVSNKVVYSYDLWLQFFKHEMYKNIN